MKKEKNQSQPVFQNISLYQLEKILSGSIEPMMIFSSVDDKIFAINAAAKKLFSHKKKVSSNEYLIESFPSFTDRMTKVETSFKKTLTQYKKSKRRRVFIIQPHQSSKTFELALNTVSLSTEQHLIFAKLRDISHQVSNKAEAVRFVRTIGHELKQPLSLIKAYTYYIKSKLQSKNSTVITEYPEKIDQQVDILTAMLNDIVDTTKLSTQRIELDKQRIELAHWIHTVLADIRSSYPTRQFIFDDTSPITLMADSMRLRQVIYNLCVNAIKYSPDESPITVSLNKTKQSVNIIISDQGIGIPKHELQKIFQPYFRSIRSKATGAKGLGLGLTLVKEIIVAHGGKIKVSSEINKGSSFSIFLPQQ